MSPTRRLPRSWKCAALAVPLAALLAACGGSSGSPEATSASAGAAGGADGAATVTLGVLPIADVAPVYLGLKKGFFADQHITVKPQVSGGGAAITAGVMSGQIDVGFSNNVSLILAASKGLPVRIFAAGVQSSGSATNNYVELVSSKQSGVRSVKDLAGKTVAVNNLTNIGPLSVNAALAQAGLTRKDVKYVEIPFPNMASALSTGRVAAAWIVEPFLSAAKAANDVTVLSTTPATIDPYFPVSSYFTSASWLQAHHALAARLKKAIDQSLSYAQNHPDQVRQIVTTYTKIPAKAAQKMTLPSWRTDIEVPLLKKTAQMAKSYGWITKTPDWSTLVTNLS